jgi:hypothetical protein
MFKHILILVMLVSLASAQTKGGKGKGGKGKPVNDTAGVHIPEEVELSPMEQFELTLPLEKEIDGMTGKMVYHKDIKKKNDSLRKEFVKKLKMEKNTFRVYTKRPNPKKKDDKMQLCINIVAKDTNLVYAMNDTIIKDPEVSKLLFNKTIGDTVYQLIYVDAFTKTGGACSGGHETKVWFVRWHAPAGKAIWKAKTINSCYKTITNMTKTDPFNLDGKSPLLFSYNKGSQFIDVTFDPEKCKLGFQTSDGANGNYTGGGTGE